MTIYCMDFDQSFRPNIEAKNGKNIGVADVSKNSIKHLTEVSEREGVTVTHMPGTCINSICGLKPQIILPFVRLGALFCWSGASTSTALTWINIIVCMKKWSFQPGTLSGKWDVAYKQVFCIVNRYS